jgi:toxin ParE1/3/4
MKYRLSALARADLDDIAEYFAQHNPGAGERLLGEIRARLKFLTAQPRIGAPRDELRPGLRCFVVGKYVIYYLIQQKVIEVLRIIHGSRDINAIRFE